MNRRTFLRTSGAAGAAVFAGGQAAAQGAGNSLRAGVATTNITPPLGASLAGNFTDIRSTENHDDLHVKGVVLEQGSARIALVLCDLCVIPATVIEKAKTLAQRSAGLDGNSILIAATHTHSAATTMPVFQSRPDPAYLDWLAVRIADCVALAALRLEPARIGWAFGAEPSLAFNRRFVMKAGTAPPNPFGGVDTVKTNPGVGNENVIKPAGPTDPTVGVLAVESSSGRPMAVLGNYSLHYVGGQPQGHVSADYFAYWASAVARGVGASGEIDAPPFVAMLFNGAQGDINNINVSEKAGRRKPYEQMRTVAEGLARETMSVLKRIQFHAETSINARYQRLSIAVRQPSTEDLSRAAEILAGTDPQAELKSAPQIYARETQYIAQYYPAVETVPVQSFRIGGLGIVAFSGEPFVEMGLAVREKSPFEGQFVIGLANHHVGYLPTERAFEEGGYETWRAKTSYLHPSAAARMTTEALRQLGQLRG